MISESEKYTSSEQDRISPHEQLLLRSLGNTAIPESFRDNRQSRDGRSILESIQIDLPFVEVRQEQAECLDAIQEAREAGSRTALIQMATGLGKTMVIGADIKRFLSEEPSARILFLCHQNDILLQSKASFEKIIGNDISYGVFTGENKDYHEVTCLFASFQAMREWKDAFIEDEFDYVVVDESQHAKATTYEPTLRHFKPSFMLGVTATPDRHDLKDIREIFGDEVYKLSLEEAIARNLLSPVDYHIIADDIVNSQKIIDAHGRKHSLAQLDRTIFSPKRDNEIVRIINEKSVEIENLKRIIFCKSITQADQYASYFESSFALHSNIPRADQDRIISHFRHGKIDTLLAIDMFNEGIDVPEVNQIIFLRSTQSRTIFLQQLGRGLRKSADKETVQVLDFVASCDRLLMLRDTWRDIEAFKSNTEAYENEKIAIRLSDVQFTDEARQILDILTEIENATTLNKNWSMNDSILYYLRLSKELGRPAVWKDLYEHGRENGGPSVSYVLRPFGGQLKKLKEAAGFKVVEAISLSREEAIDYIKARAQALGRSPTSADINDQYEHTGISSHSLIKIFGSYTNALFAADLTLNKVTVEPSRELPKTNSIKKLSEIALSPDANPEEYEKYLINKLQILAHKIGKVPIMKDTAAEKEIDPSFPSAHYFIQHFGSWKDAVRAAGFKPYSRKMDREDLIRQLRSLADALGRTPSYADIMNPPEGVQIANKATFSRVFVGGLDVAMEAAGIKGYTPKIRRYSDDELLEQLRSLHRHLGRPPTSKDLQDKERSADTPGLSTYRRRFGDLSIALKKAGLSQE